MVKLLAVSPIGSNGQTVVPAAIRKMFGIGEGRHLVGFYLDGERVEIAPVTVVRKRTGYADAKRAAKKRTR